MRVLSLGWGVQSWTLAAMAALGEIEPVEVALHADTTHEREATYRFAREHTAWLEAHGVPVVTVKGTNTDNLGQPPWLLVKADGDRGQVGRQCTADWKIAPVNRWLQANRNGRQVEQLMGISLDEVRRMKASRVGYVDLVYPLVDRRMTRTDCVLWLRRHDLDIPVKSACVFCPYQSVRQWCNLSEGDRARAIAADESIREIVPPSLAYVHEELKPLRLIDLRSERERGQLDLWENECDGVCGL